MPSASSCGGRVWLGRCARRWSGRRRRRRRLVGHVPLVQERIKRAGIGRRRTYRRAAHRHLVRCSERVPYRRRRLQAMRHVSTRRLRFGSHLGKLLKDLCCGTVQGRVGRIVLLCIGTHQAHIGLPILYACVGHSIDVGADLAPCHGALNHVIIVGHFRLGDRVQKPLLLVESA